MNMTIHHDDDDPFDESFIRSQTRPHIDGRCLIIYFIFLSEFLLLLLLLLQPNVFREIVSVLLSVCFCNFSAFLSFVHCLNETK